jgi:hypothetical protein
VTAQTRPPTANPVGSPAPSSAAGATSGPPAQQNTVGTVLIVLGILAIVVGVGLTWRSTRQSQTGHTRRSVSASNDGVTLNPGYDDVGVVDEVYEEGETDM